MISTVNAGPQLRRQLLFRLLLPLLLVVASSGAVGVWTAQRLTDKVFDRWLLDAAQSVAGQVSYSGVGAIIDLPPAATAMLAYDEVDQVRYSVTQGGSLVSGEAGIPVDGSRPATYATGQAYDGIIGGVSVRVAAVNLPAVPGGQAVSVRVSETTRKRQQARTEILLLLIPIGVLVVAAAVMIGYAVQRTLKPLELIAAQWSEQSHRSLEPIDTRAVPREIVPFATALNELLERIRSMLVHERQFAASVAHQLRTPLTGLQLLVARARESAGPELAADTFGAMADVTQRAVRLVQQLLTLGAIAPGSLLRTQLAVVDLVALVQEVGMTFVDHAAARGIELELLVPTERIRVAAHADLLAEAVANVLDNALRYTPAGGNVLIEFSNAPAAVTISDSGPGIAIEDRGKVFERFVRGGQAVGEGAGLGLAIVRDIVLAHGGNVELATSGLGGLAVTFRFPVRM
jgi:two-component system sensor histidine kinase TctE